MAIGTKDTLSGVIDPLIAAVTTGEVDTQIE